MKQVKVWQVMSGVAAVGTLSAFALAGPTTNNAGDMTIANPSDNILYDGGRIDPQLQCEGFVYDSGDTLNTGSGRTVGGLSFKFNAYQRIVPDEDWTVCGIDLDGWYVQGTPSTFDVFIYPDDGTGDTPDLGNPLTGGPIQLDSDPFSVHWVGIDVDEVCLTGGEKYYVGSAYAGDHWSAIFIGQTGMNSFSIRDDGARFDAGPLCVRLRGEVGCGPGDCLTLSNTGYVGGQPVTWTISGGTPGQKGVVVYGFNAGSIELNNFPAAGREWCAVVGIAGVNPSKTVGAPKILDAAGEATWTKTMPLNQVGNTILTQALGSDTCPDDCHSDVDSTTVL